MAWSGGIGVWWFVRAGLGVEGCRVGKLDRLLAVGLVGVRLRTGGVIGVGKQTGADGVS